MTFVMSSVNDSTPWPSPATKSPKVKGFWGSKFWGNGIFLVLISCNFSSCGPVDLLGMWNSNASSLKTMTVVWSFPPYEIPPKRNLGSVLGPLLVAFAILRDGVGNVRYEHMIEHGKFFGPIGFWAACPAHESHEHPCRCSGRSRPISTPTWTQRA